MRTEMTTASRLINVAVNSMGDVRWIGLVARAVRVVGSVPYCIGSALVGSDGTSPSEFADREEGQGNPGLEFGRSRNPFISNSKERRYLDKKCEYRSRQHGYHGFSPLVSGSTQVDARNTLDRNLFAKHQSSNQSCPPFFIPFRGETKQTEISGSRKHVQADGSPVQ